MSLGSWVTLSNIAVLIGVVLTALGGFGNFYFSKKVEAKNSKLDAIASLERGKNRLFGAG